jgi:hypothetical protein
MQDKLSKQITTDDFAWISAKLTNQYRAIKKSEFLTDAEKNCEIGILTQRALRFGLVELVDRFGYLLIDIPLENNRWAQLVIPKDITGADIEIIIRRLEMLQDQETVNQ